jgi:hypothetical protein
MAARGRRNRIRISVAFETLMDELDDGGALSHRSRHALDGAAADVAGGEDARSARLEQDRSALEQLARGRIGELFAPGGSVNASSTLDPTTVRLSREAIVPASGNYVARVARIAQRIARGHPPARPRWLSARA